MVNSRLILYFAVSKQTKICKFEAKNSQNTHILGAKIQKMENLQKYLKQLFIQAYQEGVREGKELAGEKPICEVKEILSYLDIDSPTTLREKFQRGDYGNSLTKNGNKYYFYPSVFKELQLKKFEFLNTKA